MSTKRRTLGVYASKTPLGANGERLCRNCHGPMPTDKRKHNCSQKCVREWAIKTSPSIMRQAVFDRDHGVCSLCEANTVKDRQISKLWTHIARGTGHLWQADHIVPVIEGGGECGIDGYRTLCIPCHKAVTKELHARLAQSRAEERAAAKSAVLSAPLRFGDAEQIKAIRG